MHKGYNQMKIIRLLGLCILVPMLMGMGPSRCTMPVEVTTPLTVRGNLDERLAGYWYLVTEEGRVYHSLQLFPLEDETTTFGAVYWFGEVFLGTILAKATPSSIDGMSIYSVKRVTEDSPGIFDWTGSEQEPGFIFIAPRLDGNDKLHLSFMDPDLVAELSDQGLANAQLIEVFRYDDTGETVAPSERDEERHGNTFDYHLIDMTEEEFIKLVQSVPIDELFSLHAGPFHRADLNVEPGVSPWGR